MTPPPNQTVLLGREIEVSREDLSNAKREMDILVRDKTKTNDSDSEDITMDSDDEPGPQDDQQFVEKATETKESSPDQKSENESTALEFQTPQETVETPNSGRRSQRSNVEVRAGRPNCRSSLRFSKMNEAAASPINASKVVKPTKDTSARARGQELQLAGLRELSSGRTPPQDQNPSPAAHLDDSEPDNGSKSDSNDDSSLDRLASETGAADEDGTMSPEQYQARVAQLSEIASRFQVVRDANHTEPANEDTEMEHGHLLENEDAPIVEAELVTPKRGRGRPPKKGKKTTTTRKSFSFEQTETNILEIDQAPSLRLDILTPKRGRGRPPTKNKETPPAERPQLPQVGEDDTEPATQVKAPQITPGRGRGRPRKIQREPLATEDPIPFETHGRSLRSNRDASAVATPPRRGRGRPSKNLMPRIQRETRSTAATTATPTNTGSEWEVESIQGSRICADTHRHFYEVKWKGFSTKENTWEPKRNLAHCKEAIEDYEQRARYRG